MWVGVGVRDEVGQGKSLPGKATFEQKEVQEPAMRRSGGRRISTKA